MPDVANSRPGGESKGERTRNRVIAAALAIIEEQGIAAVSQEAVARRAGLSQSALRHHFPMKEDMLAGIFNNAFGAFYAAAEQLLLQPENSPRARLLRLVRTHLDYVIHSSDRIALESFAHHARHREMLARQSAWYHWLADHYAALIDAIHPGLKEAERRGKALTIVAICLGAWLSLGRSRPAWPALSRDAARDSLLASVERLLDA